MQEKILIIAGQSLDGFYGDSITKHFLPKTKRFLTDLFQVQTVNQLHQKIKFKKPSNLSVFNLEEKPTCRAAISPILLKEVEDAGFQAIFAPIQGFFNRNKKNTIQIDNDWLNALSQVDIVILSASFILSFDSLNEIITLIKKHNKIIIIGGIFINRLKREELASLNFDFCFSGEAEGRISPILNMLLHGKLSVKILNQIPSLSWFQNGKLIFSNAKFEYVDFANWTAHPNKELIQSCSGFELYESVRGCPFQCAFCDYPSLLGNRNFRFKSAEKIYQDWMQLANLGVTHIECLDSIFTIPTSRIKKLVNLLLQSGLHKKITWSCYARTTDLTDKGFVEDLKKSGCTYIFIGIESGSQKILDIMKKGTTVEQNRKAIQNCNEVGLYTSSGFLIGFPGETTDTIQQTIEFINTQTSPSTHITLWVPHFNNPFVPIMHPDMRKQYGITGTNSTANYLMKFYDNSVLFQTRVKWKHNSMTQEEALEHCFHISEIINETKIKTEDYCFAPYRYLLRHPSYQSSLLSYDQQIEFNLGWRNLYSKFLTGENPINLRKNLVNWLAKSGFTYEL